jgi:hypothetical protein
MSTNLVPGRWLARTLEAIGADPHAVGSASRNNPAMQTAATAPDNRPLIEVPPSKEVPVMSMLLFWSASPDPRHSLRQCAHPMQEGYRKSTKTKSPTHNGTRGSCRRSSGGGCCERRTGSRRRRHTTIHPAIHGMSQKPGHEGRSAIHSNTPHTNPRTTPTHSRPCHTAHTRWAQKTPPE